ncbi:TonB-dependent receptor [Riemerella columbipharyngis]|uniref:TonB dependent receptor n=1 Tax=Riemerella columbipharyngis TaxID=1071918 RepID=A0A1G7D971_9FLAO|nr:TonB-dependent receptor [Riemerella columbipharyngis]SDE48198.1 TonB dependent receptor [Riemerella columbipharyngis]
MNPLRIIIIFLAGGTSLAFSQIKEERLILNKKREPEVKRIEKKKTSVVVEKNFPPEEKSNETLKYQIVNRPPVPDFKPSTIQGTDVSPDFSENYQKNYFRIGYGNYNKILTDGAISGILNDKVELGAVVHYLSTSGLKKDYAWDSHQRYGNVSAFLNYFGDFGKLNVDAGATLNNYNYYGISGFTSDLVKNIEQNYSKFHINGYYDFYSDNYLDNVKVKSSVLKDKLNSSESQADIKLNLSKLNLSLGQSISINAYLGFGANTIVTEFDALDHHKYNTFSGSLEPKLQFFSGRSYLSLGSDVVFYNNKRSSLLMSQTNQQKVYWFPKAEILFSASDELQFFGGIDGGLKLNTYTDLLSENPYLTPDLELNPTRTKYHFYFGIKGDYDQFIKYNVRAGFGKISDMLFFRSIGLINRNTDENRLAYDYNNAFSTYYRDASLSEIEGQISVFPLENMILNGELKFQQYLLNDKEKPYYRPLIQATINAQYTLLDKKLKLGFTGIFVSDRTTNAFEVSQENFYPNDYISTENTNKKIGGYADLNLSASYRITKNISIFAIGNNLLNTKYQTFNCYKVLGAQVLGGIKLTF